MNIITTRQNILAVADRWEKQYGKGTAYHSAEKMEKLSRLRALDLSTATVEDVGKIVSDSWVRLECDECGKSVDALVVVGQPMDYESATARICVVCIAKAARLARQESKRGQA